MAEEYRITPLPRQMVALSCPAYELMFGGQKGGSKSFYLHLALGPLLAKAAEQFEATGRQQRHCRSVIFRRNLRDLSDLINKSHQIFPTMVPGAAFNQNFKTWHFPSGATVEYGHLDGPEDHFGWNGNELMAVLFDQVEEIPFDTYTYLMAQVRTADEHYKPLLMVRATANPGGKHGGWVKSRFIDPCPAGNRILTDTVTNRDGREIKVTRAFIPSALADNPYLSADGEYEARMRASLPEHLIKMFLEGDWTAVKGAFFASLIRPDRHFRPSFPIGPEFDLKFGLDWGSTAPAAVVWAARDANDRIWVIDELTCPGVTGRIFGEKMVAKVNRSKQLWSAERQWNVDDFYGLIDSQAMGKYGSEGASAAQGIANWGFRIFPAMKDRYAGCEQLFERLQLRADGLPGIVFMKDRVPKLIEALQTVSTDPKDPQDYDRDSDQAHLCDALRFLVSDWPIMPAGNRDPHDEQLDRWEKLMRARRKSPLTENQGSYGGGGGYE